MAVTGDIRNIQQVMKSQGSNMGRASAVGGKRDDVFTVDGRQKVGGGFSGGTTVVTTSTMRERGELMSTGRELDVATAGSSTMLALKTADGDVRFASTARFELDSKGRLFSPTNGGAFAMGRTLTAGVKPNDMSSVDALEYVTVPQQLSAAEATKTVTMRMNLAASQEKLHGAGQVASFWKSGLNKTTKETDIIIPSGAGTTVGGLNVGDRLIMNATDAATQIFEFGGVVTTRAVQPDGEIYGARNSGASFQFTDDGAGNTLRNDTSQGIRVVVGGTAGIVKDLIATANGKATEGTFSSLIGLSDALRAMGLNARIDGNHRLHISSQDPQSTITFEDVNNSGFVSKLGLHNVAAPEADVKRFSTMRQLQVAIEGTDGLDASMLGEGVDFFAAKSTHDLHMEIKAAPWHHSYRATKGNGALAGIETITVTHANHGLHTGDYIRTGNNAAGVASGGASLVNNIYQVTVDPVNPDQFSLHSTIAGGVTSAAAGGAVATGDALNAAEYNFADAEGLLWQKVAGRKPLAAEIMGVTQTAIAGADVTLSTGAAHGFAIGDVIFVSGVGGLSHGGDSYDIPDGYYAITAVAGGDTVSFNAVNRETVAADGNHPAAAAGAIAGATFRRVAVNGHAAIRNHSAAETIQATNRVRIYTPNALGMMTQGFFKFRGLAADTVNLDGAGAAQITKDKAYEVKAVGNDEHLGSFFEFTPDTDVGADRIAADDNGILGADYYIDTYSRVAKELSLDDEKITFEASYVATDPTRSLSATYNGTDLNVKSRGSSYMHTQVMQVVDSLGIAHSVGVTFAKLEKNEWAVEVHGISDDRGIFDFETGTDGQIAHGILTFDKNGALSLVDDGLKELKPIEWSNGADASVLKLDWGSLNGLNIDTGAAEPAGMTQEGDHTEAYTVEGDGVLPSRPERVEITADGRIVVHYANSRTQTTHVLAAAMFKNINGMEAAGNGMYVPGIDAGVMNLSDFGAGALHGQLDVGVLEGSNAEKMMIMIDMQDAAQLQGAMAAAESTARHSLDKALDRLSS